MRPVRIRDIQSVGQSVSELAGPARAALSLSGASHEQVGRGTALVHPGRWTLTDVIDVRLSTPGGPPTGEAAIAPLVARAVTRPIGAGPSAARGRCLSGTPG